MGVAYIGAANDFNAADEPERRNESIPGPHEPPSPHRWRRKPERLPRARCITTRGQAGFRAGKSSIRRQRSFHRAAQALRTPRGRLGRRACPESVLPVWEGWRVLGVVILCVNQGPPFCFPEALQTVAGSWHGQSPNDYDGCPLKTGCNGQGKVVGTDPSARVRVWFNGRTWASQA